MPKSIRVLLVDDEAIVLEAIAALLEGARDITVVGQATTIEMARHKARALRPDIILLDLHMEDLAGIPAISTLLRDNPVVRIILLTGHAEDQEVVAAFRAGAVGFVLKTQAVDDLVRSLRNVYDGQLSVPPRIAKIMLQALSAPAKAANPSCPLSKAELRVLVCVADALSNKEIARRLGVGQPTIHAHVTS
ncbi:MAG TPA: response regulator transcription factor, partial [Caldilineaceae bacterium]|nr:response regulator transcription factor [Caldilineaceae bacterium]